MAKEWNLLPTEEAARQLSVSCDAVRRYWHSGILAGRKQGRILLIEQRAVLALQKVIAHAKSGVKPVPPLPLSEDQDEETPISPFDEVPCA